MPWSAATSFWARCGATTPGSRRTRWKLTSTGCARRSRKILRRRKSWLPSRAAIGWCPDAWRGRRAVAQNTVRPRHHVEQPRAERGGNGGEAAEQQARGKPATARLHRQGQQQRAAEHPEIASGHGDAARERRYLRDRHQVTRKRKEAG